MDLRDLTFRYKADEKKDEDKQLNFSILQWDVRFGDLDYNRRRSQELIAIAATQHHSELVLMPELCISGYAFQSKEEAFQLAEERGGLTEQLWHQLAQKYDIVIAGGIAEKEGETLYNSLVVLAPEGEIARYRKIHLFDKEKLFFQQGEELITFSVKGVRVGLMICYDGWFPELPRALALQGVDLILASGCWIGTPREEQYTPAITMHLAHCYYSNIYMACAVRTGSERGLQFTGQSVLLSPFGLLGEPASAFEDSVLTSTLSTALARQKSLTSQAHIFEDRRPEIYVSLSQRDLENHSTH